MYTIGHADEYAGQLTNAAGYDIAEVVRHGRRVEGDDAAGWATSRGLPLEHHTTDAQWQELLRLLNAAPDLLEALRLCYYRWDDLDDEDDPLLGAKIARAIAKAEGRSIDTTTPNQEEDEYEEDIDA